MTNYYKKVKNEKILPTGRRQKRDSMNIHTHNVESGKIESRSLVIFIEVKSALETLNQLNSRRILGKG